MSPAEVHQLSFGRAGAGAGPSPSRAQPLPTASACQLLKCHQPLSLWLLPARSCDSDLSPVIFASAPGGGHQAAADLRYSQLPSASPPRAPDVVPQPGRPISPPSIPSAQPSAVSLGGGLGSGAASPLGGGSRAGTPSRRAGMGAPVAWLHQMRRPDSSSAAAAAGAVHQGSRLQVAGGAGSEASWDGGPERGEQGGAAAEGSGLLMPGAPPAAQLHLAGPEPADLRPLSRADVGTAGSRKSVPVAGDGQGEGSPPSPSRSKLSLPVLGGGGGSSAAKIRAVHGASGPPSPRSRAGSSSGGDGSLRVLPLHAAAPPGKARRPKTAAVHRAAPTAAVAVEVISGEGGASGQPPAVSGVGDGGQAEGGLPEEGI